MGVHVIFERRPEFRTNPSILISVVQLLVGLGAMVGGAHLFVEELLRAYAPVTMARIVATVRSGRFFRRLFCRWRAAFGVCLHWRLGIRWSISHVAWVTTASWSPLNRMTR